MTSLPNIKKNSELSMSKFELQNQLEASLKVHNKLLAEQIKNEQERQKLIQKETTLLKYKIKNQTKEGIELFRPSESFRGKKMYDQCH